MKKFMTMTAAGALVLSLALVGCGSAASEPEVSADESVEAVDGGWSASTMAAATLTDDEQAVFDAAVEGLTGVTYTPVAVLGTQVVAGTNYAFLCSGVTADAAATEGWYVLVVYQDLEGGVELTSATDIDVSDVQVSDGAETENLVGGWALPEREAATLMPAEAQAAYEKAIEGYEGMAFAPIACLATQVVAGTNYRILCSGTMVVPDAQPALYVVDVYADLDGNAEISEVAAFDLLAYLPA